MADSRIEELPDDFDGSLSLSKAVQGPEAPPSINNVSLEDLYEKRLDGQNPISDKSFEEVMFDMSKTPLFMNEQDLANQSEFTSLSQASPCLG
jgi:hypothetical protein